MFNELIFAILLTDKTTQSTFKVFLLEFKGDFCLYRFFVTICKKKILIIIKKSLFV